MCSRRRAHSAGGSAVLEIQKLMMRLRPSDGAREAAAHRERRFGQHSARNRSGRRKEADSSTSLPRRLRDFDLS
jgi:hypothetical protein